jgi:hypothetical protein
LAPIPERSSIAGVPRDPAERTTSFVARTVRVSIGASAGWNSGLGAKATPVARFSLCREFEEAKRREGNGQLKDVPVEYRVLHVYARDYVEVRPGLFERVYHVVRHVGADARLSVYPPAHRKQRHARNKSAQLATHARETA